MKPVRDYLEEEKKHPERKREENPQIRKIQTQDFQDAMKNFSPSVSKDSSSINELREWNKMYGEGGDRSLRPVQYFL